MFPPPPSGQLNDPFGVPMGSAPPMDNAAAVAAWRERQQRQRSLRMLMMFVMMLLLMEGEEPNLNEQERMKKMKDSLKLQLLDKVYLDENIFKARKTLDKKISKTLKNHHRHQELVRLNSDLEVFAQKNASKDDIENGEDEIMIHHYPRNATGFYKGSWERQLYENTINQDLSDKIKDSKMGNSNFSSEELWNLHTELFQNRGEKISLYALEQGFVFDTTENGQQNETILPKIISEEVQSDLDDEIDIAEKIVANYKKTADIPTLPSDGGNTALQLYSTPISGMNEISYLDGFIKLFDGTSLSSRNDVLLRVRGIALHSIGRLSLLTNTKEERSTLFIQQDNVSHNEKEKSRRKLTQLLQQVNDLSSIKPTPDNYKILQNELIDQVRDEAFNLNTFELKTATWSKIFQSDGFNYHRRLDKYDKTKLNTQTSVDSDLFPFPYVPDDKNRNERKKLGISRSIPNKEELYEAKTKDCEFMINLDATPTQWEITKLEKLLVERKEQMNLISTEKDKMEAALRNNTLFVDTIGTLIQKKNSVKAKEALITELTGEIISPKCQFAANITVTALRIDWESTKGKAINYSFYMMLTCLAQIVLLLRQLLHTQAQSAASKVSILCIGWQTLLDALFCIAHILLCLIMSPLLPAFSSIAFFKLLIFGVVEMKYMAIIVRARCNSEDPNATAESIRRQVNLIQAKFYASLFFALTLFWYIGRKYTLFYVLLLYSFWVPQIIQNIITEAKRPLHKQYIYGMSITRLISPIYIFAFPNNFWKTANSDFESNFLLCQLLVLWVGLQTAILIGQSKYGTRFMIPARFLPPKYDYSRPIPPHMLSALGDTCLHSTNEVNMTSKGEGTRNRINGNSSRQRTSPTIMIEDSEGAGASLDCVICYSPIDTRNPRRYMLAPCDHLFHRECLEQWMEVKMECPICRKNLPSL